MRYCPTPVQEFRHPEIEAAGVRLLIKREDLNHPRISGNKWWKLKYNLEAAKAQGYANVLTFGGAYSNHIFATAAAAAESGLRAIGIIRGEETLSLNPTLSFARAKGMILHYASRSSYRQKEEPSFIEALQKKFGAFYTIPEGGTNLLAVKGCAEFATQYLEQLHFDHLFLPVGTGGTTAGLVAAFEGKKQIKGVSVLKNGAFLENEVARLVHDFSGKTFSNWSLLLHDHHGGYAKVTNELLQFIEEMRTDYQLPLDHVYTGKMLLAIFRLVREGAFRRGDTLLALHTGGLQGSLHQPAPKAP